MTVYVDDYAAPATVNGRKGRWSHLIADSSAELTAFAAVLGLASHWVQYPGTFREHFDVTESVKRRAIQMGAVPIGLHEAGLLMLARSPLPVLTPTG